MFEHVEPYAGDPIFALVDAFNADPRPHKVNLSIGIYFDDEGRIPVLESVRAAETRLLAQAGAKPYLPMEGAADARRAVQALLFGPAHEAITSGRVATIQSVGSSGGLKVGADFLRRWFPSSGVWISDPSWDNHRSMFEGSGFAVNTYPYYDAANGGVRFADMLAAIDQLPARSIVLLHACCHNPTGVDLTRAQWDQLIPVLKRRQLIAFPRSCLPGVRRGHRGRRLRGARDGQLGRGLRGGQFVFQEHERVRRALRRAVDRVPDGARGRTGARSTQAHRAAHLLQPGDPRRRHHGAGARRPAAARRCGSAR